MSPDTLTLDFGLSAGTRTRTALTLPTSLEFETWARVGDELGKMRAGTNWWIGDWLNFGEAVYGEKYAQAMDATGLAYQTLVNFAHVARKIAPETRRAEPLSWAHHAEVARFDDAAKQVWWLDKAEAEGWSAKALRAAIRETTQQAGGAASITATATLGEQIEQAVTAGLIEWRDLSPDEAAVAGALEAWLPRRVRRRLCEQGVCD